MGLFSLINLLMLLLSRKDNDVFLRFSHHDIGKNFGDHLYNEINSAGIRTLRDDGGIYAGQKSDIKKAIQESRISVVVFSKGYASSTKCLDQLAHIMDARDKTRLLVLPVFYNVDPSEVSEQKGLFEEAFAKHEKSFHKEMARVQSWRAALKEAADLAGMVLQQDSLRAPRLIPRPTEHPASPSEQVRHRRGDRYTARKGPRNKKGANFPAPLPLGLEPRFEGRKVCSQHH
ncbi:TMV resistance protein N isoform X1 [Populus alba x Populus x berolinensis]|nr:TMV resistance protein N isoform X1 [Populus alba x Populus x berolinensis]